MSDEEKKIEDEVKVDAPVADAIEETKEEEESTIPEKLEITEDVDAAAEVAAQPETTDETIPEKVEGKAEKVELPNRDIKPGMWVKVHERIKDVNSKGEEKERVQIFEGLVIGVKGPGVSRTMMVRKNSKGWMVEKIFPLALPSIVKIEVIKRYRTRRAKLSYLRGRFRRKMKEIKE